VLALAIAAWRRRLHAYAAVVVVLLCTQVALGILNVRLLLPLPVATAHNAVAALLLLSLIALLVRVTPRVTAAGN
jgi:heme a synthase